MPPRVLLVEDNPGDARRVRTLLDDHARTDIQVDHVVRLADAHRRLDEHAYDVVLLDLGLPDSVGLDGVAQIAAHGRGASVIVVTGSGTPELRDRAMAMGASDFIDKDRLDAARLVRCLECAAERGRLRNALVQAHARAERLAARLADDLDDAVDAAELSIAALRGWSTHCNPEDTRRRIDGLLERLVAILSVARDDLERGDDPPRADDVSAA